MELRHHFGGRTRPSQSNGSSNGNSSTLETLPVNPNPNPTSSVNPWPSALTAKNFPARRGAEVSGAKSIASDITRLANESEEEDDGATHLNSNLSSPPPQPSHVTSSELEEGTLEDAEKEQLMIQLLADLSRASNEFMLRLTNGAPENSVFRHVLLMKKEVFSSLCERYNRFDPSWPFLDISWLERHPTVTRGANIIARANLAIILDCIQGVPEENDPILLTIFEGLDVAFPWVFTDPTEDSRYSKLTLEIRTQYCIQHFAHDASASPKVLLSSIFCDNVAEENADYAAMMANGPFKSLGDEMDSDITDKIGLRILDLFHLMRGDPDAALAKLRKRFPLQELLDEFKRWIVSEYTSLQDSGDDVSQRRSTPSEVPPLSDIVKDVHAGPSLFHGPESVLFLEKPWEPGASPSSTRQRPSRGALAGRAPMHAPRTIRDPTSRELLLTQTPPPTASPRATAKRPLEAVHGDDGDDVDDDDESELFESDTRPTNKARFPTHTTLLNKRARAPQERSVLPPSTYQSEPGDDNDVLDYKSINRYAHGASKQARAMARAAFKTRRPWSNIDAHLLVRLIAETKACWSIIENRHNSRFEHARNQQAYRDKARNLKVDFLLADAPLPPSFDLVALSGKEVARVEAAGKNPYRRENDMVDGEPVNTRLVI
ncbi:hypothetical protein RJ55_05987 [Drechmeria coniospora]|nr:hypothetical protein RJ55_05987 [Drechmeria coniospora]